jgi:sec-independent protein translocase protein TatC
MVGPQHTGNSNYGFCHVLFSDYLFDTIIFGPVRQHLQYQFFCDLSQSLGLTDSFCITEFPFHQNTSMEGQVNVFIWVCLLAGFILSFPYILWKYGNL